MSKTMERRTREAAGGAAERGRRPSGAEPPAARAADGSPPPVVRRWSLGRKREVVLRLLRGETLDALSRELGVEIHRLTAWRDQALAGIDEGLRERDGDPLRAQLDEAHQRIGEFSMEIELLRERARRLEGREPPFATRRRKR